jgi:hypothetical protein
MRPRPCRRSAGAAHPRPADAAVVVGVLGQSLGVVGCRCTIRAVNPTHAGHPSEGRRLNPVRARLAQIPYFEPSKGLPKFVTVVIGPPDL